MSISTGPVLLKLNSRNYLNDIESKFIYLMERKLKIFENIFANSKTDHLNF